MRVRIDFQLNRQFGIIENVIFRFVLNGFRDSNEIARALPLFAYICRNLWLQLLICV